MRKWGNQLCLKIQQIINYVPRTKGWQVHKGRYAMHDRLKAVDSMPWQSHVYDEHGNQLTMNSCSPRVDDINEKKMNLICSDERVCMSFDACQANNTMRLQLFCWIDKVNGCLLRLYWGYMGGYPSFLPFFLATFIKPPTYAQRLTQWLSGVPWWRQLNASEAMHSNNQRKRQWLWNRNWIARRGMTNAASESSLSLHFTSIFQLFQFP